MSLKFWNVVRILVVFGLFLAVPLIAFEQRFGGSPSSQRGTNVQGQQTAAPKPAADQRSGGQGQKPGQGRDQGRGPWEWWKDEAVKKEMGLSTRQVRDITKIVEDRARLMKPHSDELERQTAELEKMIRERVVEVPTFAIKVSGVEALRTELSKSRLVMFYTIYKVLTPEQYEKLRKIRDERGSGRGGGGPR